MLKVHVVVFCTQSREGGGERLLDLAERIFKSLLNCSFSLPSQKKLARGFVVLFLMDSIQYLELLYEFHMIVTRQPLLRDTNPGFILP